MGESGGDENVLLEKAHFILTEQATHALYSILPGATRLTYLCDVARLIGMFGVRDGSFRDDMFDVSVEQQSHFRLRRPLRGRSM